MVCTKPLVGRSRGEGVLEECDQIVRLAQSKGLKFLVGQTMRFDPVFHAARQFFDDGDLGDILMAESHYVHDIRGVAEYTPWRVDAPQDFLFGGACHPIDTLRWFFGDVEEVFVYANRSGLTPEYPIEDNFMINLKFTKGTIARILAAYGITHPPIPMMGLSLYGTKGSIRCDYTDFKGGHVHVILDKMNGLPEFETSFEPITEGSYGHGHAVRQYMAHLEDCIVNDRRPSPTGGGSDIDDGRRLYSDLVCSGGADPGGSGRGGSSSPVGSWYAKDRCDVVGQDRDLCPSVGRPMLPGRPVHGVCQRGFHRGCLGLRAPRPGDFVDCRVGISASSPPNPP